MKFGDGHGRQTWWFVIYGICSSCSTNTFAPLLMQVLMRFIDVATVVAVAAAVVVVVVIVLMLFLMFFDIVVVVAASDFFFWKL